MNLLVQCKSLNFLASRSAISCSKESVPVLVQPFCPSFNGAHKVVFRNTTINWKQPYVGDDHSQEPVILCRLSSVTKIFWDMVSEKDVEVHLQRSKKTSVGKKADCSESLGTDEPASALVSDAARLLWGDALLTSIWRRSVSSPDHPGPLSLNIRWYGDAVHLRKPLR